MPPSPFPDDVAFELARSAELDGFTLFAQEEAALSPLAVAKRRREFALGRLAARRAMQRLSGRELALPRADDGRPLWPSGWVGSITHTDEVAIAAVAPAGAYRGIGIDLERRARPLKTDITGRVCTAAERTWLAAREPAHLLRLFAAKEVVFKTLYPLERVYLDFHDAELTWREEEGAFRAVLNKAAAAAFPVGAELRVGVRDMEEFVLAFAWV